MDIINYSKIKKLGEQINHLDANKQDNLFMPDGWKTESDLPEAYTNNSVTCFRITTNWNGGKITNGSIVKTTKYNDLIIKQESFRVDGIPLYYRLFLSTTGVWGTWQEIVTTIQPQWINATLQNGWTGTLQYRRNQIGQLEIKAELFVGTNTNPTLIANLPSTYRPIVATPVMVYNINGSVIKTTIVIHSTGDVYLRNNDGIATGNNIIFNTIIN